MEEIEEIDTSCARRAQPCVRGTKAVALNIMIMVDKQNRNGGQAVCNNTNKVKCKEKRSKSPCKKSKKKECCNSGYDNFMPPPSAPNAQMLPCGCVVVYDDPRPKTNAEIQCSQRQPDKCCKGNQFNACISSASQTTIKQEGCSKCDKEKRGCTNNSCQTSNQVAAPQCSKAKQCGRCRTTGCQATAPDKCSSSKKRCGSTKCSSCQTSAQSHIHAPRLCGACSKNHCQHCTQRQQPKLCGACASSSSVGSNRHCHKTSSECQTHATCIPKTKEQMNHARVGDDVIKEVSRTQMKREQSGQKIVQKEESKPKFVQREESRPKVVQREESRPKFVQREESRPKVVQREESRPKVKESKIPTCIPAEVAAKTDRSIQSFYSSMVVNKPPPVPADPIPTPVESAFPMGRSLEPQKQDYPEPQRQEEPEPQKQEKPEPQMQEEPEPQMQEEPEPQTQEEPEPLEDMIELQPPTAIDEPVEEEAPPPPVESQPLPPNVPSAKSANIVKSQPLPSKMPSSQSANMVKSQQLPSKMPSAKSANIVKSQQLPSKMASSQSANMVKSQQLPPTALPSQKLSTVKSQPLPPSEAASPPQEIQSYIEEVPEETYAAEQEEEEEESYVNQSPPALYEDVEEEETRPSVSTNDGEDCGECDEEEEEQEEEESYEYGYENLCNFGQDSWAWNSWNKFVSLVNGEPIPNPCVDCLEDGTPTFNQTMESPDLEYGSLGETVGGLLRTDMMSEDTCILLVALPLVVLSLMASFKRC